ncbi:MAG: AbrB family transcriptional regulator, partial [Pseudomonadota bacterium]|nr:AbrB family transcriptional regulator [Pseudomonadota bacterium]
GWLSGAMLGVAALAACGGAAPLPKPVQQLTVLLAGVGMGSGLTPATLHTLARYPLSLVALGFAVAAMTGASYFTLLRAQFNRTTAFYAAVPGALSYVFLTASRSQADLARVAVIQVFRIFVLMAIVPLVARLGVGAPNPQFAADPVATTAALLALAAAAGAGLDRLGVANGALYAGIFISAGAHVAGFAPGRLAPGLQILAQALVGAWVGARFIGFDWRLLRHLAVAATLSFLAAFAVAAGFSALVSITVKVSYADALAAFAPGGLEAMTMMAFALGLDPLFVGAHHIARFLLISLALPWAARWIGER